MTIHKHLWGPDWNDKLPPKNILAPSLFIPPKQTNKQTNKQNKTKNKKTKTKQKHTKQNISRPPYCHENYGVNLTENQMNSIFTVKFLVILFKASFMRVRNFKDPILAFIRPLKSVCKLSLDVQNNTNFHTLVFSFICKPCDQGLFIDPCCDSLATDTG